jgi:hypothetical protein
MLILGVIQFLPPISASNLNDTFIVRSPLCVLPVLFACVSVRFGWSRSFALGSPQAKSGGEPVAPEGKTGSILFGMVPIER